MLPEIGEGARENIIGESHVIKIKCPLHNVHERIDSQILIVKV